MKSYFRQSLCQSTNTNQGSTWYVLATICNCLTQLSELMYPLSLYLLMLQHIKTRKNISSESTRIPLPKDLVICQPKHYFEMLVYFEDTKTWNSWNTEPSFKAIYGEFCLKFTTPISNVCTKSLLHYHGFFRSQKQCNTNHYHNSRKFNRVKCNGIKPVLKEHSWFYLIVFMKSFLF